MDYGVPHHGPAVVECTGGLIFFFDHKVNGFLTSSPKILQQLLVLTMEHLEVYDVGTASLVDRTRLAPTSLVSYPPVAIEQGTSDPRVAHSLRVYKGKVFLLVSLIRPTNPIRK